MARDMDYFNSICKISRAFSTTLKKQQLLDLIVDTAIQTMSAKGACLFLKDKETDHFTPMAQKGLSRDYIHSAPQQAKTFAEHLVKNDHLAIDDAVSYQGIEGHDAKKIEGIASILAVPVNVHDTTIGILTLYTKKKRKFSKNEIAFLTALAEQGGIAIDRARLIENIRRNTMLFHDLAANMNAAFDLKQIMATLTVDLGRAFKARGISVLLVDEDEKALTRVAGHGLTEDFLNADSNFKEQTITKTLKGETVYIKDISTPDSGLDIGLDNRAFQKEGIVSLISAPIRSGNQVIGVLRVYFGASRDFYDDEIMMINAVAHQAGLAIRNTTCFLSLENEHKELKEDIWSHRSWF